MEVATNLEKVEDLISLPSLSLYKLVLNFISALLEASKRSRVRE